MTHEVLFCPKCGSPLEIKDEVSDVATYHITLECLGCDLVWEATYQNGVEDQLLHLSPKN